MYIEDENTIISVTNEQHQAIVDFNRLPLGHLSIITRPHFDRKNIQKRK